MNLNRIRLFRIVAGQLNLTRASQLLHVSQSSLSHQLAILQKDYGVRLYKKNGRGIDLTTEGQQFLGEIQPLLAQLEHFDTEFRRHSDTERLNTLTLAGTYALSADSIPLLLANFQKINPQIQLSLSTGNQRTVEKFLVDGKVEIALTTSAGTQSAALKTERYGQERIAAFVPIHHPLAKKRKVTLSELLREPLVLRGASGVESTRKRILMELKKTGRQPKVAAFYDSAAAVKVAVRKNTGVGLLYEQTVKHDAQKGDFKVLKIDDLNFYVDTFFVHHKIRSLSDNAKLFLNFLRRQTCKQR